MRSSLRPVLGDVLLACVLTGLTLVTLASQTDHLSVAAAALAVLSVAPLALRQQAPVLTMSVIAVALAAGSVLGYGELPSSGVGMLVAMFTVATLRPRSVAAAMFATAVGVMVITFLTVTAMVWSQLVQSLCVVLGAWVLGESTRRWGLRTERLAARAAQAVADERVRIARELHDIVAHHMSVISLQAGVAEYVLDIDPPAARKAIATVSDSGREAMLDMRRLLDVLRVDRGEQPDYQPQPGLAVLAEMVARIRGAGLPVELTVTGEERELPPGPDLCAYRVVQESLTNVLKHAGPAEARVEVDYGERTLTVRVGDNGTKVYAGAPSGGSLGLRGMRERAELYGGVLTAGPDPAGGFTVLLRLPMEETR